MDTVITETVPVETRRIVSTNKFVFLNIITFNLYAFWWTYKAWRLFKERGEPRILPAVWTILSVFTLYSLFERIKTFTRYNERRFKYSSGALLAGIIIVFFCGFLPGIFSAISMLQFIFFIRPLEALNYGIKHSKEYSIEADKLSTGQFVLIIAGSLAWLWIIFFS